jgi:hypothetical protein
VAKLRRAVGFLLSGTQEEGGFVAAGSFDQSLPLLAPIHRGISMARQGPPRRYENYLPQVFSHQFSIALRATTMCDEND